MESRFGNKYEKRDEDRRSRKLFIGGVSFDTNDEDFFKYFARFGELEDCVLIREKDTGQSRGFGFVTYKDKKISEHVATQQLYLDGRRLDPKPSISRYSMDQIHEHRNQTTKVFVGGLHDDTAEAELTEYFCKFGEVLEVNIMYDRFTNSPRGFGFVTFKEPDVAQKCIDWTEQHMIHNKKVDCKPATARKDAFNKHHQTNINDKKKATSREERWRQYHGDELRANALSDPYRDHTAHHLHSSTATSAAAASAYPHHPQHSSIAPTHSSYAYSSTHPIHPHSSYSQHPHHSHSSHAPPPPHHPHHLTHSYPPTHHPYPPPPHSHYPPPHDSRANPTTASTVPTTGTTATATTSSSTTANTAATQPSTTVAATNGAAATYDYSRYDPYYRHDTRYNYAPNAATAAHSTHPQHRPPYDYSHYNHPYPYSYGGTATTAATSAPRYDYYQQYSTTPATASTATSATGKQTIKPLNTTNPNAATTAPNATSSTTTITTKITAPTNIPTVAAPIKVNGNKVHQQQNVIPTSYGVSRGSAATNSAQTSRYNAY